MLAGSQFACAACARERATKLYYIRARSVKVNFKRVCFSTNVVGDGRRCHLDGGAVSPTYAR